MCIGGVEYNINVDGGNVVVGDNSKINVYMG